VKIKKNGIWEDIDADTDFSSIHVDEIEW